MCFDNAALLQYAVRHLVRARFRCDPATPSILPVKLPWAVGCGLWAVGCGLWAHGRWPMAHGVQPIAPTRPQALGAESLQLSPPAFARGWPGE